MGWANTLITATSQAFQTFRHVFANPETAKLAPQYATRLGRNAYLQAWYDGTVFDNPQFGPTLKASSKTYRQTRLLWNMTTRLNDFWGEVIYPGMLSHDGKPLPKSLPLAIPLPEEMPDEYKAAIAQIWQWSYWQENKNTRSLYAATLGTVLTELVDDVDSGKICANVVWDSFVKDIKLADGRYIESYILEYWAQDNPYDQTRTPLFGAPYTSPIQTKPYLYTKEVTKEAFRTYKDGKKWDYELDIEGGAWEIENRLGFVPAVWDRFTNVGGTWGAPAVGATLDKMIELNSIMSHIHDQVHKVVENGVILWSDDAITDLVANNSDSTKRGPTDTLTLPEGDRESFLLLKGSSGGRKDTLAGDLDFSALDSHVERMITEIKADHPEEGMWQVLREMSQVTGPAVNALFGDVKLKVDKVRANMDQNTVALMQMAVTMAGERLKEGKGGWANPTAQQKKFATFDITSYDKGELDFWIPSRGLVPEIPPSALDKASIASIKMTYGVSNQMLQKEDGYTPDEIKQMAEDKAKSDAARLAMANLAMQGGGDSAPDVPGSPQTHPQRGTPSTGGRATAGKGSNPAKPASAPKKAVGAAA